MALAKIPNNTVPNVGRQTINNNFDEIELRLQFIESTSYILSGDGTPSNTLGNNGDYYIDRLTFNLYYKTNGAWQLDTPLEGRGYDYRGEWVLDTQYYRDDLVYYAGSIYWVHTTHISAVSPDISANCELWASKGDTGEQGIQGIQGEPGVVMSTTAPTETDVLWADTTTPSPNQFLMWQQVTQAEYDAIATPDPNVLYVVVG